MKIFRSLISFPPLISLISFSSPDEIVESNGFRQYLHYSGTNKVNIDSDNFDLVCNDVF